MENVPISKLPADKVEENSSDGGKYAGTGPAGLKNTADLPAGTAGTSEY